jgi:hypothetical protein
MTDVRADEDDDRLPWLEAVEEEERGPSPVKLIAAVVIGLIAIGIVVGGLFWLGNRNNAAGGEPEVIASPGAYKTPAPDPGGMKLDNSGSTQVATSEGTEQTSSVNPDAGAETPVNQPAQPRTRPAPPPQGQAPAAQPPAQPRPQPPAQPRLTGPTIQVGAYPSAQAANREWARLTQRFPYLRSLDHAVMTHQRGGQTFYRLRAAGGEAQAVCRRLRAARQPCMDVND